MTGVKEEDLVPKLGMFHITRVNIQAKLEPVCRATYPFQNPNESERFFEWSQVQRKARHRFLVIKNKTINKMSSVKANKYACNC